MSLITRTLGLSLSILEILKIGFVTAFYGLFLPGYVAGGAVRWYLLSRRDRKPVEALLSITYARLTDIIALSTIGVFCGFQASSPAAVPIAVWSLAGFLAIIMSGYIVVMHVRVAPILGELAAGLKARLWRKVTGAIAKGLTSLNRSLGMLRTFPVVQARRAWYLSFVCEFLGIALFFCMARAVGLQLSLIDCAWVRAVVQLLLFLPISVSGIGLRETALIGLLMPFGISPAKAIALSFLLMLPLLIWAAIGWVVSGAESKISGPTRASGDWRL